MNYEDKILELERRIAFLEGEENKRIKKRKIKIAFEIIKIVLVLSLIIGGYVYIYSNFIKPYKETIDSVNEKIDGVEEFIGDKWDLISKYNIDIEVKDVNRTTCKANEITKISGKKPHNEGLFSPDSVNGKNMLTKK